VRFIGAIWEELMENQILVKTKRDTRSFRPAATAEEQIELVAGTIGVLTALETSGDTQIAWVLWDPERFRRPKPVLAVYIEAVGIRMGRHSVVVE
jgi:hypothetical protein